MQGGGREGPLWGYSNPGVSGAVNIVLVELFLEEPHQYISLGLGATTTDGKVFATRRKDA